MGGREGRRDHRVEGRGAWRDSGGAALSVVGIR